MDLVIGSLDQIPRLDASLAHLKSQHVDRAIPAGYWPVSMLPQDDDQERYTEQCLLYIM